MLDHVLRSATLRWVILASVFGIVVYAGVAGLTVRLIDIQRDSCERGNAIRLADFRESSTLESAEKSEWIRVKNPLRRVVIRERIEAYEGKQEVLIETAERTGYQTTPGAVTISCADASPRPLPWFD